MSEAEREGPGKTANGPSKDREWTVHGRGRGDQWERFPRFSDPRGRRGERTSIAASVAQQEVRMAKSGAKRVVAKAPHAAFSPAQRTGEAEGKKARGSGRGGTKRNHRTRNHRSALQGITKNDVRRLARRAGVQRVSLSFYDVARKELKRYLKQVLPDIAVYTEHAQRVTVLPIDVLRALKRRGQTLYGFWPGAENLTGAVLPRHKRLQKVKMPLRKPVVSPVKAFQVGHTEQADVQGEAMDAERLQRLQTYIASYFLQEHVDSCPVSSLAVHVQRTEPVTEGELEAVILALQDENRVMYLNKTVWLI